MQYFTYQKRILQINTNRSNLSEIINDNIKDLPFIKNDTNNVIKFNSGYENNNENYKRNFWDLLKMIKTKAIIISISNFIFQEKKFNLLKKKTLGNNFI